MINDRWLNPNYETPNIGCCLNSNTRLEDAEVFELVNLRLVRSWYRNNVIAHNVAELILATIMTLIVQKLQDTEY